jgi:hypothetical protein
MNADSAPTLARFSFKGVPKAQRHEVIREVSGRAIANLDLTPKDDDPQMEVEIRLLPGVSPHLARTYDLSRGDDDSTPLWSTTPARGWVNQCGRRPVSRAR